MIPDPKTDLPAFIRWNEELQASYAQARREWRAEMLARCKTDEKDATR